MIDIINGNVTINDISLYSGMKKEDFISKYSKKIDKIIDNGVFQIFRLFKQNYNNYLLSIGVEFENFIIKQISISPLVGDEENFWDNWSEERELKRLKLYEKFMEKEISKSLQKGRLFFDWGNIYVAYDSKSATVLSGINYKYD